MDNSESVRKSALTIILGAGFSQSLRVPGTVDIGLACDTRLQHDFGSVYTALRDRLRSRYGKRYNFEVLAAALEACEQFGDPDLLAERLYLSAVPEVAKIRDDLTPRIAREMYERVMSTVYEQVSLDWASSLKADIFDGVKSFFARLETHCRLDVGTLNYDLGAEAFVTDFVDGFVAAGDDTLLFDSADFLADDGRSKIAHLHGSIQFRITETSKNLIKITGPLSPRHQPLWTHVQDGTAYTAIVTGAQKPSKLALPPYSVYFAWLGMRLLSSPRVLVCGYGIGDVHVNVWLSDAARHHGKAFRLVLVYRYDEHQPPTSVMRMFAMCAGYKFEAELEAFVNGLSYANGIASSNGVAIVRTGLPLNSEQLDTICEFLMS